MGVREKLESSFEPSLTFWAIILKMHLVKLQIALMMNVFEFLKNFKQKYKKTFKFEKA